MFDAFLVAPHTVVTAAGDSAPLDLSPARYRVLLVVLDIEAVVEQQMLEVSLFGSADGATWTPKPLASYPQKFYRGTHPLLVDLAALPELRFLRAHWEVSRWGRGSQTPMFTFSLRVAEVPPEMLRSGSAAK